MHACVTYSHVGDWYITAKQEPSLPEKLVFIFWQAHLQAFFMGLLFFVSGYFAHGALTRRGPGKFLRERALRLGLPALFYMLVIHPFILLGLNPWDAKFPPIATFYAERLRTGRFLGNSGPLWFAFALLIFCLVLVAWRTVKPAAASAGEAPAPGASALWLFGLLLGVSTFGIRLFQPLGTNVINFQLGYFPQYIAAFIVGVAAARHGWLLPLAASPQAQRAGRLAITLGPVGLLVLAIALIKNPVPGDPQNGGWHWQALALAFWEQLTGLGLSLGLLAFLSRRLNRTGPGPAMAGRPLLRCLPAARAGDHRPDDGLPVAAAGAAGAGGTADGNGPRAQLRAGRPDAPHPGAAGAGVNWPRQG
jgi:hypothetical protein